MTNKLFLAALLWLLCTVTAAQSRNPFFFTDLQGSLPTQSEKLYYFKLHYANGPTMIKTLTNPQYRILNIKSRPSYDQRTHQLLINTNKLTAIKIASLLHHLDQPTPQVLILARIINIDSDYINKLGLTFTSSAATHPASTQPEHTIIPILSINHSTWLRAKLNFLAHTGHAKILASPMLFTLDQQTASIESGSEIPYQQTTKSGATSIAFKKAVMRLSITPSILPQQQVLLKIQINQDNVSNLHFNGEPAIKTQKVATKVIVTDHHTVVLGGIFSQNHIVSVNGIPILQDIPILGHVFRNTHRIQQRKELLVLITPLILRSNNPITNKSPRLLQKKAD